MHTQGGAHKRRSIATTRVLLFKGPQARRCIHKAVQFQGGAYTRRCTQKALCSHCRRRTGGGGGFGANEAHGGDLALTRRTGGGGLALTRRMGGGGGGGANEAHGGGGGGSRGAWGGGANEAHGGDLVLPRRTGGVWR